MITKTALGRCVTAFALTLALVSADGMAQDDVKETGRIVGKVVDSETGEGLPIVSIMLMGTQIGATADLDGLYRIEYVPPGTYTATFLILGYAKVTVTDVKVKAGQITTLNAAMTPEAIQMGEVVVTAKRIEDSVAGLLATQKKAAAISDGIAAEQISRTPDSDAAATMKRVTGLTVVDNKYVYVRGLGERYSNTQLNGASLPSPEPNKRVVPMDILPANLLEKVVVSKAFTPDQPGDFSGGSVRINTKEFPEKLTVKFSASSGMNTQTTFKDFKTYSGGDWDFLGFDDGTRSIPDAIPRDEKIVPRGRFAGPDDPGFTNEERLAFSKAFNGSWSARTVSAPADQSYSFSLGNQNKAATRPLGFLASLSYGNKHSFREEERNTYSAYTRDGKVLLDRRNHFDIQKSTCSVRWGGLLNFSYKPSQGSKLGFKTLYTRDADDVLRTYDGIIRDYGDLTHSIQFSYLARSLLSSQLVGEHVLPFRESRIEWRATVSRATSDEPDRRELLYDTSDPERPVLLDEPRSGLRFYSALLDLERGASLDWSVPFEQWAGLKAKLKTGGGFTLKDRDLEVHRYHFSLEKNDPAVMTLPPDSLFMEENLGTDGFLLYERTLPTDNYDAEQKLYNGYLMVDLPLTQALRVITGARVERSEQLVKTFDLFSSDAAPVRAELNNTDILPAVNLTYALSENMNLRTALSQTVTRPDIRELSPFEFSDYMDGVARVGNPDLQRTLIQNVDARWEYYPRPGELLATSLFFKNFMDPVEQTIGAGANQRQVPVNAERAHNYGAEFELRSRLDYISPYLAPFSTTTNLALIRSEVEIGDSVMVLGTSTQQTSSKRPLQGQSPYVINVSLSYKHPGWNTEFGAFYHVFGRRIANVGFETMPDLYEEARHSIDVTLNHTIGRYRVKFSAKNLLDSPHEFTQGGKVTWRYETGRSLSLGISYSI